MLTKTIIYPLFLAVSSAGSPLFNGKNLDGWTIVNGDKTTWVAKDNMIVTTGDLEVFVATQGDNKTGSITGHLIKANLVDQNEWCTIEINQENGTVVYLNDVPILTVADAPSIKSDAIRIDVHDAKLRLRKSYIK